MPKKEIIKKLFPNLTSTQCEVVNAVVQGLTNDQVGTMLGISPKTVKFHLTNIYRKTGVSKRSRLMFLVFKAAEDAN